MSDECFDDAGGDTTDTLGFAAVVAGSAAIVSIASLELRDCVRLVNLVEGRSGNQIFGYPNDLEFKSSMTLFAHSAADNKVFE